MAWTALGAIEQAVRFQAKEESRLFWFGPPSGDLAEIEAFCRLHRLAESLHTTVMDALRSYSTVENPKPESDSDRGDVSLVEENVAARLVQLMSLLHTRKTDLLCGSRVGRPQEESPLNETTPFAKFRAEVRECCRPLETALDKLLPADSEQRLAVRRSLLKLMNACLDSGFARPEGLPKHADIPNLAVVRFRPSKSSKTLHNDEDVAFWRGGQITEEGLEWLLQKGFRMIVDIREEKAEHIAEKAIREVVDSGKLKFVRLHIERGKSPTQKQVEEFSRLVEDHGNRPLYLQSLAGVGRASALVSSWRESVLREKARERAERKALANRAGSVSGQNGSLKTQEAASELVMESPDRENSPLAVQRQESFLQAQEASEDQVDTQMGAEIAALSSTDSEISESASRSLNGKVGTLPIKHHPESIPNFSPVNAFEAQRPPDVLHRPSLSRFMKQKKGPSVFMTGRVSGASKNAYTNTSESTDSNSSIAGPAGRWGLASPGIPHADRSSVDLTTKEVEDGITNKYATGDQRRGNTYADLNEVSVSVDEVAPTLDNRSTDSHSTTSKLSSLVVNKQNGALFQLLSSESGNDDESVAVQGDMCASTTGVVRLQSRKKAEMFLVRTDGYSCTRERVKESTLAFTHPSTQQQMLMWKTPPRTCLLLKKLGDELLPDLQQVASFLYHQEGMNVVVEPDVHDRLARLAGFGFVQTFYSQDTSELHERVDFVVCLGGDGVILHASNLFRNAVPPVVSFNLGSLGFLTTHPFKNFKEDLRAMIHGYNGMMTGVYITLRMRLRCELFRHGKAIPGKVFEVLNEVVVDRGSNPYLSKIECYERCNDRNRLITKVQADGVIIATPTGSTAYSTAAGGSMVHPNVPCMLFTPICPHSLSFRPVILPDSALLELKVPRDARNNAWVSFDGKKRQQLSKGDSVRICMSEHPLPTVNKNDQTDDWFQSLVRCLNWNERLEQRPLNMS